MGSPASRNSEGFNQQHRPAQKQRGPNAGKTKIIASRQLQKRPQLLLRFPSSNALHAGNVRALELPCPQLQTTKTAICFIPQASEHTVLNLGDSSRNDILDLHNILNLSDLTQKVPRNFPPPQSDASCIYLSAYIASSCSLLCFTFPSMSPSRVHRLCTLRTRLLRYNYPPCPSELVPQSWIRKLQTTSEISVAKAMPQGVGGRR